jgi:hypothetical protein
MLPTSVVPREKKKITGLHPPWVNSFEVVPTVFPNWRVSIGLPAAMLASRERMRAEVFMMIDLGSLIEVVRKE